MRSRARPGSTPAVVCLLLAVACTAPRAAAQAVEQDDLDFQGRSSLVLGAGARALGMAGAFLARADDATAASWNPAGLSYLRQTEITFVGSRNLFDTTLDKASGANLKTDSFRGNAPDFAAVAFPVEFGRASGAVQISYQRTFAFFAGERDVVQVDAPARRLTGAGGFDVISVGSGLQVLRNLRFGATVNRWVNGFDQERERLQRRRSQQEVEFGLTGWNLNLGVLWSPIDSLNLGAVAKTPFRGKVELTRRRIDFVSTPEGQPDQESANFARNDGIELEFPGAVGAGLSWRPTNPLTLCFDYTRTFWSDARVYDYYTLPQAGAPVVFPELPFPLLYAEQVDTAQFRVGAEYVFLIGKVRLPVRAGYLSDRQYFTAPNGTVPRFDGVAVGAGIAVGKILFDAAYLEEKGEYLSSAAPSDPVRTNVRMRRLFVSVIYRR